MARSAWTSAPRLLSALAVRAARKPLVTVVVLGALATAGALLALSLRPTAATDTLVGRSSADYRATQRFYSGFGEEPVQVLVKGDLRKLLLSSDIERLAGLEGCLSGNLPSSAFPGEGGSQGPCAQLTRSHAVKVALGPGTFVNEAALQIDSSLSARRAQAEREARSAHDAVYRAALARGLGQTQASTLARQASKATLAGFAAEVSALAIRYGLTSAPSIEDREFVSALVFAPSKSAGTPKQRFAYLFPGRELALVSVRLRAHLSAGARAHAIALIRQAVRMPQWRLQHGESYSLTGEPVIAGELESSISRSIELLLVAVLVAMALILSLLFRGRPRLLPLGIALLAGAGTFGALAAWGASLTIASVAVLPVLVGLAVDYAIQFQSRLAEALVEERSPHTREAMLRAVRHSVEAGAPAIGAAVLASIGGLLVLLLSPVPMVRGFGVLLVVGVALAFVCALLGCSAALMLGHRMRFRLGDRAGARLGDQTLSRPAGAIRLGEQGGALSAAWRGAREILTDNPLTRLVWRAGLGVAVQRPRRVLGVGLALAALGWGLDTQTSVQTDISKLAPQSMASLSNLRLLERTSGVGGELDLLVSGRSLATPATIAWMSSYESTVLHRFGYTPERGCGRAQLCPAFSLPDLFRTAASTQPEGSASTQAEGSASTPPEGGAAGAEGAGAHGAAPKLTQSQVNGLLGAIPPYLAQDVIGPDRRTAVLSFGIRLMPLQDQQRLIDAMHSSLHPPAGVRAQLAGLSVLAARSGAQIASAWRRVLMLLAALGAVALLLLTIFRGDARRALVPLIPIALATGWSALVLFAIRVPLNPMSVTLGALVIAVSTEFSVLLSERHRQELRAGYGTVEALQRAYRHTGAAVVVSGVTAIAGFGVLMLSDIAMLRDFGVVTLVDLSVSLVGVLIALPAAVMLVEGRERRWARASGATSPSLG